MLLFICTGCLRSLIYLLTDSDPAQDIFSEYFIEQIIEADMFNTFIYACCGLQI